MINRAVEEALDLVSMEVHGDETIDAGGGQHIGNEFGANGNTWLVLSILTCPSEIWNNGSNLCSRSTLGCIDHEEQLHQVVSAWEGALNEKYILAANGLFERYAELSISKGLNQQITKGTSQVGTNLFGEVT